MLNNQQLFEHRQDEMKNQYSTFIEELEETAEQLMQQVFDQNYQNDIITDQIQTNTQTTNSSEKITYKMGKFHQKIEKINGSKQMNFQNFIHRNDKWVQNKNRKIHSEIQKNKEKEIKKLIFKPTILRGSKQKIQPIFKRCLQIQKNQKKKLAKKRVQKTRQSEEQISRYTFKPQLSNRAQNRTLEEYIRDKQAWERKKFQNIQCKKIVEEAKKYEQCTFKPHLISKKIVRETNEPIQIRLLRSLQK